MTALSVTKDLAPLKLAAERKVDQEAEQVRLKYVTAGDGQQLEYAETAEEARLLQDDPAPVDADYPMLVAERDAQTDAGGTAKTLSEIATEVLAQRNVWLNQVGNTIKRRRRAAKLKIANATTPAEIDTAATVDWSDL